MFWTPFPWHISGLLQQLLGIFGSFSTFPIPPRHPSDRSWEEIESFIKSFFGIFQKKPCLIMMFIWKMQRQLDFLSYLGPYQHHWSVGLVMPNLKIVKMLKVPQYNALQWSKLVLKRLWPHLAILPQCFQSFPGPQRKSRREKRPAIAILFHFFSFSHFLTVFG